MGIQIDRDRLLQQLKEDEGFITRAKWDLKQWSYGYGCRAPGEGATITEPEAAKLLAAHMSEAIGHFERIFKPHLSKFDEVRASCFIQLIFNMGPGRADGSTGGLQSFKNTLGLIFNNKEVPWASVAENLKKSLWYRQIRKSGDEDGPGPDEGRGERIVRQVATGQW